MKTNLKQEIKTVLKVAKWEFALKFLIAIINRGILLAIPILFSVAVNAINNGNKELTITMIIISILLAGIYRYFEGVNQIAYFKLYSKIFNYYNDQALTMTKENSLFSLSRFSLGQYTNMVINDVDIISGFFTASVVRIVQLIESIFIFFYFYSIDFYIFIFTVVITIIMIVVSLIYGNKVQKINEKRKTQLDAFTSSTYDYIGGIREIKSFNIFDKIYPNLKEKRNNYLKAHADYNINFNCTNSMTLYVFELCRLLAVLYIGLQAINGHADVGVVLVIYNYYQKIIDNFLIVLTQNIEYRNFKVSLERFNHIREYSNKNTKTTELNKDNCTGLIEFKKVLYGFRDNPILNKISFKIPGNAITVLSGGDETAQIGILDLLLRLNRQHEGDILIDKRNISDITDQDYYSLVSTVRRQTVFFDIPIKENFMMINPDFNKILEVCKEIGLDEEINKLDKGYDTIIDENTPLSMSAKKLLVIVRMLLSESKILLIDDVINVLNKEHEKKLMNILSKMKKDHTIIIITNSKKVIAKADQVLEIYSNKVIANNKE